RQRCLLENAQLVLGSATPSLESFYQSQKGDYALGILENRYFSAPLPQVEVADMRRELREGNRSIFSRILAEELAKTLANGEQSLVLINRRGYYTFFSCRNCGKVILCPHCDIPMAYHEKENKLKCHYCGALAEPPRVCPQCGSSAIRHFGIGTQRVADEL
ncbi:MAG: primosomal protein N', partial [Clostridiales bacterium]